MNGALHGCLGDQNVLNKETYSVVHYCFLQLAFIFLCLLEGRGEGMVGLGKQLIIAGKYTLILLVLIDQLS